VVCGEKGQALYFSRQPIPFLRGVEPAEWLSRQPYYKHVGIYAFRAETLKELVQLEPSPLEKSESLEQLRWLENGYTIQVRPTAQANIGIDTPEDLAAAEQYLLNLKK
jgi:3-deoxy-manno-octulosonate cytidylyltransferase (CMP-KDO synthetase)